MFAKLLKLYINRKLTMIKILSINISNYFKFLINTVFWSEMFVWTCFSCLHYTTLSSILWIEKTMVIRTTPQNKPVLLSNNEIIIIIIHYEISKSGHVIKRHTPFYKKLPLTFILAFTINWLKCHFKTLGKIPFCPTRKDKFVLSFCVWRFKRFLFKTVRRLNTKYIKSFRTKLSFACSRHKCIYLKTQWHLTIHRYSFGFYQYLSSPLIDEISVWRKLSHERGSTS
jgi:hypothetical protein